MPAQQLQKAPLPQPCDPISLMPIAAIPEVAVRLHGLPPKNPACSLIRHFFIKPECFTKPLPILELFDCALAKLENVSWGQVQ